MKNIEYEKLKNNIEQVKNKNKLSSLLSSKIIEKFNTAQVLEIATLFISEQTLFDMLNSDHVVALVEKLIFEKQEQLADLIACTYWKFPECPPYGLSQSRKEKRALSYALISYSLFLLKKKIYTEDVSERIEFAGKIAMKIFKKDSKNAEGSNLLDDTLLSENLGLLSQCDYVKAYYLLIAEKYKSLEIMLKNFIESGEYKQVTDMCDLMKDTFLDYKDIKSSKKFNHLKKIFLTYTKFLKDEATKSQDYPQIVKICTLVSAVLVQLNDLLNISVVDNFDYVNKKEDIDLILEYATFGFSHIEKNVEDLERTNKKKYLLLWGMGAAHAVSGESEKALDMFKTILTLNMSKNINEDAQKFIKKLEEKVDLTDLEKLKGAINISLNRKISIFSNKKYPPTKKIFVTSTISIQPEESQKKIQLSKTQTLSLRYSNNNES